MEFIQPIRARTSETIASRGMYAMSKRPNWITAIILVLLFSGSESTIAASCIEAMESAHLASLVGDPKATIAAVRREENVCGEEFDPASGAVTVATSYFIVGNYAKALEYANQCLYYSYSEPNCHLFKIKSLEHMPRVKDFNEQRTRAFTACFEINRSATKRLNQTDDELERIGIVNKQQVSRMCIDEIMQIKKR
jgi:hypothetical protein